jgi:hypothetical protein
MVFVQGPLDGSTQSETRVPVTREAVAGGGALDRTASHALGVRMDLPRRAFLWPLALAGFFPTPRYEIYRISSSGASSLGRTALETDCTPWASESFLCACGAAGTTSFWLVGDGAPRPLMRARLRWDRVFAADGRRIAALDRRGSAPAWLGGANAVRVDVVEPEAGRAYSVDLAGLAGVPFALDIRGSRLAIVTRDGGRSIVAIYDVAE